MLIGGNRAEAMRASAALYCAGARIVTAAADIAVVIEAKALAKESRRIGVPLIAIVPPSQKRKMLKAKVDAAYARPAMWKSYTRLVGRVLEEWTPTRKGSRRRRARSS